MFEIIYYMLKYQLGNPKGRRQCPYSKKKAAPI
jgi:hypothetical protein